MTTAADLNQPTQGQKFVEMPKCHIGTPLVFTDPTTKQKWYAGGKHRQFKRQPGSILVALYDGVLDARVLSNINDVCPKAEPTIFIDWTDQAAAPLNGKNDWKGILRGIRGHGADVSVACMGGHGRTGTFLAIMGWLMGLPQEVDKKPVQFIRDSYCVEAVESMAQFKQIKEITGVDETNLFVSYVSTYTGGFHQGSMWDKNDLAKASNKDKESDRAFHLSHDPEMDLDKYGWFDAKRHDGRFQRFTGQPAGYGEWRKDGWGWFWKWDDNTAEEYYPSETEAQKHVDAVDDEDDTVTKDFKGAANAGKSTVDSIGSI